MTHDDGHGCGVVVGEVKLVNLPDGSQCETKCKTCGAWRCRAPIGAYMRSLLIFEKDPAFLQSWQYLLRQRGLDFSVTADEEEAVSFCRFHVPELIVASGESLARSGRSLGVMRELREAAPRAIVIVLWPARAGAEVTSRSSLGADYNVVNPGDFAVLLRMLDSALARKRHQFQKVAYASA